MLPRADTHETVFFGIPSTTKKALLLILTVAIFAKLGWELRKWYAGRRGGR